MPILYTTKASATGGRAGRAVSENGVLDVTLTVPKELGEGLRQIADPELRACLESLAGRIAATCGAPTVESPTESPIPVTFRSE